MNIRGESIATELLKLRNNNGLINPSAVVAWAQANPQSQLYGALEWDDKVAGERWRVSQVRHLIAMYVVDVEGSRQMVSLSIDRRHDGSNGYRPVGEVITQPTLREIMVQDALADLERVQARYSRLAELQSVWAEADKVRSKRTRKAAA